MQRLKGAIFSLRDVILHRGKMQSALMAEVGKLIVWLKEHNVQPVFVGNNPWVLKASDGSSKDIKEYFAERWGEMPWYIALNEDMPLKPTAASMEHVLGQQGWETHEAIYIGNTEDDMKTARNGNLMFLNAVWHGEASPYGYQFDSPLDVARFVDCFCLAIDIGSGPWKRGPSESMLLRRSPRFLKSIVTHRAIRITPETQLRTWAETLLFGAAYWRQTSICRDWELR